MNRFGLVLSLTVLGGAAAALGQASGTLPEAPAPAAPPVKTKGEPAVPVPLAGDPFYAPVAFGDGPEPLRTKTIEYVIVTFGPRALVAPAFSAAIRMARPLDYYPREWKDGGAAFGRNYGAALGSKFAFETGRYAAGALLHEDFRYRPSTGKGLARLVHAIGYTLVDAGDGGERRLALANFVGAAAGGFSGDLWLPDGDNGPRSGARRAGIRLGVMAGNNVAREYAPEILKVVHALHVPFPTIPVREWWTSGLSIAHP